MNQIYHPYTLWEDHEAGFYNSCSGKEKTIKAKKVVEMFNSKEATQESMMRVIDEWPNSCQHNLTNPAMNKIAYIGQGACCLYASVPSTVTMDTWSSLNIDVRNRANKIAAHIYNIWKSRNKTIQLCLNFD